MINLCDKVVKLLFVLVIFSTISQKLQILCVKSKSTSVMQIFSETLGSSTNSDSESTTNTINEEELIPCQIFNITSDLQSNNILNISWIVIELPNTCDDIFVSVSLSIKPQQPEITPLHDQVPLMNGFYTTDMLSGCSFYELLIKTNSTETNEKFNITTNYQKIREVQNISHIQTESKIMINWNKPLENPNCVKSYQLKKNSTGQSFVTRNTS